MNTPARITVLCLLSLALGGAVGWLVRGALMPPAATSAVPAAAQPVANGSPTTAERRTPATQHSSVGGERQGVARLSDAAQRLKALVWFKRNGLEYLQLPVFRADGLAPQFIQIFELSPAETAALNEGIRRARGEIVGLARAAATVTTDANTGAVIVNVPSIPGRGGQVYDALLAQFRSVLGPDRFEQFDAVAGTSFESGLDSFGAEASKYELTQRIDQQGKSVVDIKRSFAMPNASGWSNNTVAPEDLAKTFPVLSGLVLPPTKPAPAPTN